MKSRLICYFLLFFLSSCAGYNFNTNNNPLLGFDIKSVAVPMFVNRSVISNISPMLTKEIILALTSYSGLKTHSGDTDNVDSVLIGVISSNDRVDEVIKSSENIFVDGDIKKSIGTRRPFYYSSKSSYELYLDIYLIKKPTPEEIKILTQDIGPSIKLSPRIVLNDRIPITGSFTRVTKDTLSASSGGEVNFTKNRGLQEKSLQEACYQTAQNFKQVVLNAF